MAQQWTHWEGLPAITPMNIVDTDEDKKALVKEFLSSNTPLCTLQTTALPRPASFVDLEKWFVGQLPPKASKENIAWLFTEHLRIEVACVEKIKIWCKGGKSTGCFHIYCTAKWNEQMEKVAKTVYCTPDLQVFSVLPKSIPSGWSRNFMTVERAESKLRHNQRAVADETPRALPKPAYVCNSARTMMTAVNRDHSQALHQPQHMMVPLSMDSCIQPQVAAPFYYAPCFLAVPVCPTLPFACDPFVVGSHPSQIFS